MAVKVNVNTDLLNDSSVTTDKIVSSAVTGVKIADNTITSTKYQSQSVDETALANDSVSSGKIVAGAVTASKIGTDAVTTTKIQNSNVTRAKLEAVGHQFAIASGLFSTTSNTFTTVTNQSLTITTSGRPVIIGLQQSGGTSSFFASRTGTAAGSEFDVIWGYRIRRDTVSVSQGDYGSVWDDDLGTGLVRSTYLPITSVAHFDDVSSGTYTYDLQVAVSNSAITLQVNNIRLFAYEL